MEKDLKSYMMSLMSSDHRHESMSDMMLCGSCGQRFKKAEKVYNEIRRSHPEKVKRKPQDVPFTSETENLGQMLTDRIRQDNEYRKHLKLLAFGSPEQRTKELLKEKSGFYERYSGYERKYL